VACETIGGSSVFAAWREEAFENAYVAGCWKKLSCCLYIAMFRDWIPARVRYSI